MKLSIIIPAYNEEKLITRCLDSVFAALAVAESRLNGSEVIVADNDSTDATADLARQAGARVVHEPVRQIARARNAGAAVATGDWFLFIDGDSILHADSLIDMLDHIETRKYVGGGCVIGLDEAPLSGRFAVWLWNPISRTLRLAAGSFVFCRADAFREVGGFDEEFYAAEELVLTDALKKWGRTRDLKFVILREKPHISSGRKFYLYSKREIWGVVFGSFFRPRRTVREKKYLGVFYDGRR